MQLPSERRANGRPRYAFVLGLLAAWILLPLRLTAETAGGNALPLLDAYLSQAAESTPEFRADLQAGADPARIPPGRRSGLGPVLGPFTYRPKTYNDLDPAERAELLRDPKLRAYLILRGEAAQPTAGPTPAGRSAGAAVPIPANHRLAIDPEEMLRSRPFEFALPSP